MLILVMYICYLIHSCIAVSSNRKAHCNILNLRFPRHCVHYKLDYYYIFTSVFVRLLEVFHSLFIEDHLSCFCVKFVVSLLVRQSAHTFML